MRKQLHIIFRLVMFSCILLFVSQEASAQITFSVKNQTIRQTIRVIEKKADYSFFYTDKLPGLDQKISLTVSNESIDAVLEKVFKGSSISYKIESGKQVVLTLKSEQNAPQKGDKKTITGVVSDRRGEPLIGVTVRVEGENIGTATDIDGRFSLEAPVGAKVSFSYIGYVSQSHTVNKQNVYNVSLSEDSQVLEEVVVVGYGFMKRKDITTAVSVVSTADIEERPIMTAAQAIQGKAAGIQVVQPSGMPGSGVTIRVRGATSVQASNEPLYVVDGLPSDDISNISPNDIESMQILKDASSAAIYGARAANGVVLITTKRGKIGAPQVKMSAYVGFSKLGKKIDALNTEQYKDLMKDLKAVSDVAPNIPESETRYVDWTDLFFGTGVNQNYQLSVANGTEKLQYFVSGGYSDEQGIVEKAHFNRYNFRANLDSEQTKWLKMALNFAYSHTGGQWVNESRSSLRAGSILSVVNTPPFMQKWNPYDPNEYDEQAYGARILNPLAANAADSNTNTDHINGSLGFTVDIFKGLKFKTTFGIELTNEHWDYYLDPISTSDGRGTKGRVEESFGEDPFLVSQMGVHEINGYIDGGISPMLKVFGPHGVPTSGLNLASTEANERDLREVFLKPYEVAVKQTGVNSVMTAYNSTNRIPNTASKWLLTDLLRTEWGFKGYTYSDWGAVSMLYGFHKVASNVNEAVKMALMAGTDLEASSDCYANIPAMVRLGELDVKYVDLACSRVLYAKFKAGLFENPYGLPIEEYEKKVRTKENVALSRRISEESVVMVKNEGNLLPLDMKKLKSVAVIGPNANQVQFGDYTWSRNNKDGITPLQGIQNLVGNKLAVHHAVGCDLVSDDKSGFADAVATAKKSDVVFLFVGSASASLARDYSNCTCGEGYDLTDLNLTGVQGDLVKEIYATGKAVVLILVT